MTVTETTTQDFKVADISLAEFGRKEIRLAEHEMPGLMAMREDASLSGALERWFEEEPERPAEVDPGEWLRWEQEKHERLLLATTT